ACEIVVPQTHKRGERLAHVVERTRHRTARRRDVVASLRIPRNAYPRERFEQIGLAAVFLRRNCPRLRQNEIGKRRVIARTHMPTWHRVLELHARVIFREALPLSVGLAVRALSVLVASLSVLVFQPAYEANGRFQRFAFFVGLAVIFFARAFFLACVFLRRFCGTTALGSTIGVGNSSGFNTSYSSRKSASSRLPKSIVRARHALTSGSKTFIRHL